MSDRFFVTPPLTPGEFALDGPEAHHLVAVRRFQPGDRITLFTGDGFDYPAEILSVSKRTAVLRVDPPVAVDREVRFPLVIAAALPKGDRADFLIEKLTELGVTRFIPLVTSRSVVIPKESTVEKLRRAVIEASKQCGRNVLLTVDPATPWTDLVRSGTLPGRRLVLHTGPGWPWPTGSGQPSGDGIVCAVGPEGGFSAEEVAQAVAQGWQPTSLGPRTLRVETAAIAAAILAVSSLAGAGSEGLP